MTIFQVVNNISKSFYKITSEENKHKKFNYIIDLMLSLYYKGKDREKQEILPIEERIFTNAQTLLEASDLDKYQACIEVILSSYEQMPYTDILGEFYQMEISNGDNAQFFTPDALCNLMAQISTPEIKKDMRINDDSCGCGRTLLASARYIASQQEKTGIKPQDCFFIGKDLDDRCIRITLLNFCLHKLKGFVTCGDTLLNTAKYKIFIDYTFPRKNGNGKPIWTLGKMSQWEALPQGITTNKAFTETKQKPTQQPIRETEPTIDLTNINKQTTLF